VRRRIRAMSSPAMIVACIAVVLAMTGSALAARDLITGADIKDGSITRADLSGRTISSLKGKRGPSGSAGRDGFAGPAGPQGSTGPQGDRGPAGPPGPQGDEGVRGDKGDKGDTGATGAQGPQGPQGDPGAQGTAGQSMVGTQNIGATDVGTPLARASSGPAGGEGVEISNGGIQLAQPDGVTQYKVDVFVSFVDTANPGTEFGVARLFLDGSPLDGVTADPFGGSADGGGDTTLVTSDVPDDMSNPAQASASFIITPQNDGGGGEQLTLVGALRSDDNTTTANVTAHVIVTRIG
jgi:hypothetical protein